MPKNQKKTGRQNYDWAKIKHDYITDPSMSLRKAAKKYGVSLDAVAHKSKAESWFAARKEHQNKIVTDAITQTGIKQANELSRELGFLNTMKDRMAEMLDDSQQFHRHITSNAITGESEEVIYEKVDTKAMKDSMQMIEMMEKLTRSLLDIQRLEVMQKHQIDVERLELEKERVALERERNALRSQNTDADNNFGVVLIPEVIAGE